MTSWQASPMRNALSHSCWQICHSPAAHRVASAPSAPDVVNLSVDPSAALCNTAWAYRWPVPDGYCSIKALVRWAWPTQASDSSCCCCLLLLAPLALLLRLSPVRLVQRQQRQQAQDAADHDAQRCAQPLGNCRGGSRSGTRSGQDGRPAYSGKT